MLASPHTIIHLVHPRPAPWSTLISAIANDLGVPLVEYKKWLSALESHVPSGSSNEVEAMAAGTLKMIAMIGFKFSNMNDVAIALAPNLHSVLQNESGSHIQTTHATKK